MRAPPAEHHHRPAPRPAAPHHAVHLGSPREMPGSRQMGGPPHLPHLGAHQQMPLQRHIHRKGRWIQPCCHRFRPSGPGSDHSGHRYPLMALLSDPRHPCREGREDVLTRHRRPRRPHRLLAAGSSGDRRRESTRVARRGSDTGKGSPRCPKVSFYSHLLSKGMHVSFAALNPRRWRSCNRSSQKVKTISPLAPTT